MRQSTMIAGALAAAAFTLAGCWTFNETPFPEVAATAITSTNAPTIAVNGFAATVTGYTSVSGYQTVYVPGHCGRYHYHPGYYGVVPTVMTLEEQRPTQIYLQRAKDAFEAAGAIIGAQTPDWTVEVTFLGPAETSGDATASFMWKLCTVFFCDYATASWSAKLKIRDNRSGRLVFTRDYVQTYETKVFGLIPIFSIAACENTSLAYIQGWCLTALTDKVVAEATAFLSQRKP